MYDVWRQAMYEGRLPAYNSLAAQVGCRGKLVVRKVVIALACCPHALDMTFKTWH